jgi:(1->4)-alpha-D-glucan 1-alpha-D-glucosylmutase
VAAFLPFQQKIAYLGAYNSLAQTLLKITCPGIPDFYQGTELWDLNLVDPDNRRPVDFPLRQRLLAEITEKPPQLSEPLQDLSEGKAKLYLTHRALQFRNGQKKLFEQGDYIPLAVKGNHAGHVVAFCRKETDTYAVAVAPRFLSALLQPNITWEKGIVDWADTHIELPQGAPKALTDIFTGKTVPYRSGRLLLSDILSDFPAALLWGDSSG